MPTVHTSQVGMNNNALLSHHLLFYNLAAGYLIISSFLLLGC